MRIANLFIGLGLASIAVSAQAQQTIPPHVDMPVAAQLGRIDATSVGAGPAAQASGRDPSVTLPSVSVVAGNGSPYLSDSVSGPTAGALVVKGSPVPDTEAARKLYRPLSRAAQRTAAAGN